MTTRAKILAVENFGQSTGSSGKRDDRPADPIPENCNTPCLSGACSGDCPEWMLMGDARVVERSLGVSQYVIYQNHITTTTMASRTMSIRVVVDDLPFPVCAQLDGEAEEEEHEG